MRTSHVNRSMTFFFHGKAKQLRGFYLLQYYVYPSPMYSNCLYIRHVGVVFSKLDTSSCFVYVMTRLVVQRNILKDTYCDEVVLCAQNIDIV